MGLLSYEKAFSNLKLNAKVGGEKSPHKVAMLFAVIELIEQKQYTENRITLNDILTTAFSKHFTLLKGHNDHDNPYLPFFHLRSSGFWHHQVKPGKLASYQQLTTAKSPDTLNEHVAFAYLDDELFELLNNQVVRILLKSALEQNLTVAMRSDLLSQGKSWSWLECESIVEDYFSMLEKELRGIPYSKTEHRGKLLPKLNNRSAGSAEFKHQNISAVLLQMGLPYISGYKPALNYQQQLYHVVLAYVAGHPKQYHRLLETADYTPKRDENDIDWSSVYDPSVPEIIPSVEEPKRLYIARKINYAVRESNNRDLGTQGEAFVLEFEKWRLTQAKRDDLAKEVEWSSLNRGDGLGFDIRSFNPLNDEELFIEVKTTTSGKYQPFFITDNEVAFSKSYPNQYNLYRVYDFRSQPRIFQLPGPVDGHVQLIPKTYQASFSKD